MNDGALIEHVPRGASEALLVDPTGSVLEATVDRQDVLTDLPSVRVLSRADVYEALAADFTLASDLAGLVERDALALRAGDDVGRNPVVITDDVVVVRIEAGRAVEHVATDEDSFVSTVRATYREAWAAAEPFELGAPARSRLKESLLAHEELGESVWRDLEAMLDRLEANDGDRDAVAAVVLAAARNERQLYHVSRWGEDVGLASTATFSRVKTRLEERGIVETVRVPVEVGRPRQRLTLAEGYGDADLETLAEAVA